MLLSEVDINATNVTYFVLRAVMVCNRNSLTGQCSCEKCHRTIKETDTSVKESGTGSGSDGTSASSTTG